MLVEETQVPEAALPVEALKRHLRLGSGFAEDDLQDGVLASFLRAAIAAIEGRTDKALIAREFKLSLSKWRNAEAQKLPIAPIQTVEDVSLIDRFGGTVDVDASVYRLKKDPFEPVLYSVGTVLPNIPHKGTVEVRFVAGFGPSFDQIPGDLFQAVLLLAAHYYEYRDETALSQGCMPFGVTSLIARYRSVRLGTGT